VPKKRGSVKGGRRVGNTWIALSAGSRKYVAFPHGCLLSVVGTGRIPGIGEMIKVADVIRRGKGPTGSVGGGGDALTGSRCVGFKEGKAFKIGVVVIAVRI